MAPVGSPGAPAHRRPGLDRTGPAGVSRGHRGPSAVAAPRSRPVPWPVPPVPRLCLWASRAPRGGLGRAAAFIGTRGAVARPAPRLTNVLTQGTGLSGPRASPATLGGRLRETGGGKSAGKPPAVRCAGESRPALGGTGAPRLSHPWSPEPRLQPTGLGATAPATLTILAGPSWSQTTPTRVPDQPPSQQAQRSPPGPQLAWGALWRCRLLASMGDSRGVGCPAGWRERLGLERLHLVDSNGAARPACPGVPRGSGGCPGRGSTALPTKMVA